MEKLNDQALINYANTSASNMQKVLALANLKYEQYKNVPNAVSYFAHYGEPYAIQIAHTHNPSLDLREPYQRALKRNYKATARFINDLMKPPIGWESIPNELMEQITSSLTIQDRYNLITSSKYLMSTNNPYDTCAKIQSTSGVVYKVTQVRNIGTKLSFSSEDYKLTPTNEPMQNGDIIIKDKYKVEIIGHAQNYVIINSTKYPPWYWDIPLIASNFDSRYNIWRHRKLLFSYAIAESLSGYFQYDNISKEWSVDFLIFGITFHIKLQGGGWTKYNKKDKIKILSESNMQLESNNTIVIYI